MDIPLLLTIGAAGVFVATLLVGTVLLIGFALRMAHVNHQRWLASLSAVAHTYGLRLDGGGWFRGPVARGNVDGARLVVDSYTQSVGKSAVTYTRLRCRGGLPDRLVIRPEDTASRLFGAADVRIGDPALDRAAILTGEPVGTIRGRMDAETRAAVTRAVKLGARLEGGWWTLSLRELVTQPDRLVAIAGVLLEATYALGVDDPDGLARVAATDPLPEVRRNALASLLERQGPGLWLRPFTADPDGRVAVVAASALGPAGRDVLLGLLDGSSVVHRQAALALARLEPGPVVERALLSCLGDGDTQVIDALGRVGTATSVPALAPLADAHLGLGAVAQQAKAAIRAIQGRLVGAERGALALAEGVDGALSLADDQARVAAARRSRVRAPEH